MQTTKRKPRIPRQCPSCGSQKVIPIEYGMPGPELIELAEKGKVALGGCCVSPDSPTHECADCGVTFGRDEEL